MAETAYDFNSNFLGREGTNVADALFDGITSGEDMPLAIRQIIARIPNLDELDERSRWSWDGLDDDLLEADGNDLDQGDIDALKAITAEFFADLQSPENIETAAHLYLLSVIGENYTIPDGSTALEQIPAIALQARLSAITSPRGDQAAAMGADIPAFTINPETALDPASPEFIESFGNALTAIQEDMRTLGSEPPLDNANMFLDPQGLVDTGTVRDRIIEAFLENLDGSDDINAIRELTGDERYNALAEYVRGLDDEFPPKSYYMGVINTLSPDASGHDLVRLAVEYGVANETDVNKTALHSLHMVGEDRAGMLGEQMLFHLEAYLQHTPGRFGSEEAQSRAVAFNEIYQIYLTLPEAQRTLIDTALEAGSTDAPGVILPPTPEEIEEIQEEQERVQRVAEMPPEERGRLSVLENAAQAMGIPVEVFQSMESVRTIEGVAYAHYDEGFERGMREIFQDNWEGIYGRAVPGATSPSERLNGDENLWRFRFPEDGVAYEYQIDPSTGDIDKYRVGADGQLYTTVSAEDNTPIMLAGDHQDFNIFHPNLISQTLLQRLTEQQWEHFVEEAELDEIFTRMPDVEEMSQGLELIEQRIKEGITAIHPDIEEEELESIYQDIRQNDFDINQLKERLRAPDSSESVVLQINTLLIQMNAIEDFQSLAAMRDYANYTVSGILPSGITVSPPSMQEPWEQNFDNFYVQGEFQWERATEFRILPASSYASLHANGTTEVAQFEGNDYAMSYIEAQGWEGTLDTTQTGMIVRALMVKESADRYGIDDPNSDEARAAFLQDFQNAQYNLHDVELMMRSFDSNGQNRAEVRHEHDSVAYRPGDFNDAADIRHRSALFHNMFAQPVELMTENGNTITVDSTISRDDAVRMFWRDFTERRELGYDRALYGLDYDEMVERHGNSFVAAIAGIMENSTDYQRIGLRDANNPIGDFRMEYARRYQANYEAQAELQYKADNEVVSLPESTIIEATLDAATDIIIAEPEIADIIIDNHIEANSGASVTPEDLFEAANDITAPSPAAAAVMQGTEIAPATVATPGTSN